MSYVIRQGKHIEVETITSAPAKRHRTKSFAKVPLAWAAAAAKATRTPQAIVWVWLHYTAWKTKSASVRVSNAELARYGVNRGMKRRALAALEASGLITVKRRHAMSPVVTLIELQHVSSANTSKVHR